MTPSPPLPHNNRPRQFLLKASSYLNIEKYSMVYLADFHHSIATVNYWLFDANFNKAIKFEGKALDECCKQNSMKIVNVGCKQF